MLGAKATGGNLAPQRFNERLFSHQCGRIVILIFNVILRDKVDLNVVRSDFDADGDSFDAEPWGQDCDDEDPNRVVGC